MAAPPESWCLKPCSNSDLETPYTSKNHSWREDDDRIDSRIRHFFKSLPWRVQSDDSTWVPLLNSDILAGGESLASSIGLRIFTERILSSPNNNSIPLSIMIPDCASSANKLPCVVYCHGGGMSHYSCFYNNFQTWSRLLAHAGAVVVMPDFRNSATPSLQGEDIGPFPSGLNDCVSAVRWCQVHLNDLHASHIIIAGESGGGNLAISTALFLARSKENIICGVYSLCPMIRGSWGGPEDTHGHSSWNRNAGIFMDYNETIPVIKDYGMGSREADRALHVEKNALAWPGLYADPEELQKLRYPPTVIVVNEFDPLLDDGVKFYEKCKEANISHCELQCLRGTTHGVGSYLVNLIPELSQEQCCRIVAFACGRKPTGMAVTIN